MTYMLSSLDILVLFIFSNPVEIRITVIYISDTERCLKSTYMFTYFEWKKKTWTMVSSSNISSGIIFIGEFCYID